MNDDNPGDFQRYSVGLEALTSHADWSINLYRRISDVEAKTTDAGTFIVYTAEGWDGEIALRIPGAEWLELAARRYEWERERSGKLVGFDYRLSFLLLESFSLDATFDAPEDGDSDWGVNARFHFDLTDGFHFRRASAESLTDPWHRRYESVRRRYEQRIIEEITALPTPAAAEVSSNSIIINLPVGSASGDSGDLGDLGDLELLTTPPLSEDDFDPEAQNCVDSGDSSMCQWAVVRVAGESSALAAQTTEELAAGEIACVINRNNDGCRIALILSPAPALLTQDIRVEITEVGGFPPPSAPLILAAENFFEVEFSSASAAAFAEDNKITVSVSANTVRSTPTTITIALGNPADTATPIADYQLLDSSNAALTCVGNNCAITLAANATVASFQITAHADSTAELTEVFSLMLIEGSNYALTTLNSFGGGIIGDIDGGEAAVQFSAANLAALDEGSAADITVQADAVRSTPTTVTILLVAGTTATPGTDYQLLNSGGTVISCDGNNNCAITIAANAQNEIIQVTAFAEGDFENIESFSLMLIDGSDYALATPNSFTGEITGDIAGSEASVQFSAANLAANLAEGNAADITVQANAVRNTPTIITISLGITSDTATPDTTDRDYQLLDSSDAALACDGNNNCTITLAANAMMEEIKITAIADATAEAAEAFSLTLIDGGDYRLDTQTTFSGMIAAHPVISFSADTATGAANSRFEITVLFEPSLPQAIVPLSALSFFIRGHDDDGDLSAISPTACGFAAANTTTLIGGRALQCDLSNAAMGSSMAVVPIMLNSGIASDTIEISMEPSSALQAAFLREYDTTDILTVTIP